MLCEVCQQRDALVHLSTTSIGETVPPSTSERHLCRECADELFAKTSMNSARGLIRLSGEYREKLYDLLAAVHPEAFDNSDSEACRRGSEFMRGFLREHLTKDRIELNADGFEMLLSDFFGSHHFYRRADNYWRGKA